MAEPRGPFGGPAEMPAEGSPERRLLESVPWTIDAGPQIREAMLRALFLEAPRLAELSRRVRFSLVAVLGEVPPELLDQLALSARCQSYDRWELILVDESGRARPALDRARWWAGLDRRITLVVADGPIGVAEARNLGVDRARGDFLILLDPDDLLHPSALGAFARHLDRDPIANLISANEAQVDADARRIAWFTASPPFDLFTLLRTDDACRFAAIHRDLVRAASPGGRAFRPEFAGVEQHDLMLRVALTGDARPLHLPLFLRYRRMAPDGSPRPRPSGPEPDARRVRMLKDLLPAAYPGSRCDVLPPEPGSARQFPSIKLRSLGDHPRPTLLILIPFRDNPGVTLACLDSLEWQEHALDVLVALIDNGSEQVGTRLALDEWLSRRRRLRYEVIEQPGPFNFARINNAAVDRLGDGRDLLLFLNNDVELLSIDCLQTLAMQALADPDCGVLGIKLVYPGGAVQHGGVRIAEHVTGSGYSFLDHAREPRQFVDDERIAFGVTFACAMACRAVFEELGGLDEVLFPNGYGDVDLCARALEAGYRNYYFGTLIGLHHESRTRGQTAEDVEFAALHERHAQTFARWRIRELSFAERHAWPLPSISPYYPPPEPTPPVEAPAPVEVPEAVDAIAPPEPADTAAPVPPEPAPPFEPADAIPQADAVAPPEPAVIAPDEPIAEPPPAASEHPAEPAHPAPADDPPAAHDGIAADEHAVAMTPEPAPPVSPLIPDEARSPEPEGSPESGDCATPPDPIEADPVDDDPPAVPIVAVAAPEADRPVQEEAPAETSPSIAAVDPAPSELTVSADLPLAEDAATAEATPIEPVAAPPQAVDEGDESAEPLAVAPAGDDGLASPSPVEPIEADAVTVTPSAETPPEPIEADAPTSPIEVDAPTSPIEAEGPTSPIEVDAPPEPGVTTEGGTPTVPVEAPAISGMDEADEPSPPAPAEVASTDAGPTAPGDLPSIEPETASPSAQMEASGPDDPAVEASFQPLEPAEPCALEPAEPCALEPAEAGALGPIDPAEDDATADRVEPDPIEAIAEERAASIEPAAAPVTVEPEPQAEPDPVTTPEGQPPAGSPPPIAPDETAAVPIVELPLRYRIADRVNNAIKRIPGPIHRVARFGFLLVLRVVRRRSPRTPTPADPRADAPHSGHASRARRLRSGHRHRA